MVWCLYSYFVHGLEAWDCLTPTVGLKVLHHCGYLALIYPCRDSILEARIYFILALLGNLPL